MHIHVTNSASNKQEVPVWLAVLTAAGCQAISRFETRSIRWTSTGGKAIYTNTGAVRESVQPFGLTLEPGDTLAVSWQPRETEYTLEICRAEHGAQQLAA